MERISFILPLLLAISAYGYSNGNGDHQNNNHHSMYHDGSREMSELIKQNMVNIGIHFDYDMCTSMSQVGCQSYTGHDEEVCGSDGLTYNSNCHFVQAHCKDRILTKAHTGACHWSTTSTSTPSTSGSLIMVAITTGSGFATTTKAAATTMSAILTTTMSIHNVFGSVFCQYKSSINCPTTLNVVCGSDGTFYPNTCELLKLQCDDPILRVVSDSSGCSLSP